MEKINFKCFIFYLGILCFLLCLCFSNLPLSAYQSIECNFYEETLDIDYDSLGKYKDLFIDFESIADAEENNEFQQKGFFGKWCKKLKNWFKKKTIKMISKILKIKKGKNLEECAYNIAKFKRKIDKKLYKTGHIDNILPANGISESNYFKERIKFYYNNKKVKPPKEIPPLDPRFEEKRQLLEDVPKKILVAYVEFCCGSIIAMIPFPGCNYLGLGLMSHASTTLGDYYIDQWFEEDDTIKVEP